MILPVTFLKDGLYFQFHLLIQYQFLVFSQEVRLLSQGKTNGNPARSPQTP